MTLHANIQLSKSTWWSVKSVSLGVSGKAMEWELNTVEHEAGLYINGSRAQLQLFPKAEPQTRVTGSVQIPGPDGQPVTLTGEQIQAEIERQAAGEEEDTPLFSEQEAQRLEEDELAEDQEQEAAPA